MRALRLCVFVGFALAAPGRAMAQHHHGGEAPAATKESSDGFGATVTLIAASFDNDFYGGDYEGVAPALSWTHGRWAASAALALYRLNENGRSLYGPGDVVANGSVLIVDRGPAHAGVSVALSAPTGDHLTGLGMGHVMVMPSAWGSYALGDVVLGASVGVGRGVGDIDHVHGVWPLVEPMNLSEITWAGSGDVALTSQLHVGARVLGAAPLGQGTTRVAGGVRAAWTEGRVVTGVELQAGLAGDPFTFRGVLDTTVRF